MRIPSENKLEELKSISVIEKEFVVEQFSEALVFAWTSAEVKVLENLADDLDILDDVKSRIYKKHQEDMIKFESLDKYLLSV